MSHYHPEGTCRVTGSITLRDGERIPIDAKGFRDLSVGPRNWDYMRHYRLAWPIFDNGLSIVAVHGFSTTGKDAWMRTVGKDRSEERRVGKDGVGMCRSRWAPENKQKK